ncbi:MAG: dihydroorotase [Erysipelotrichaceae bacterium]|nr:dihydroorotase [Erysipelotrichaceae bacterium]
MSYLIKNGEVYFNEQFIVKDLLVDDNGCLIIADSIDIDVDEVIDATGCTIMPGLIDPHVHLREPGFEYKETINSGTKAAALGGFTTVFSMPNLNPVPYNYENLKVQLDIIIKDANIHVYPMGSITKNQKGIEISNMEEIAQDVIAFSDDGVGVQDEEILRQAMIEAKKLDSIIVVHCEDNSELKPNGCIHEGITSKKLNLVGINSASEYNEVIRDIKLAKETGCQLHICHVSTKESVEAIRQAKKDGVNISAEVTVHHLLLNEEDVIDDGNFKMNPPLRSKEDQKALINGVLDNTIEMICTDHAPHSKEEKSRGLTNSPFGIIGLEFAFPLIYTYLVKENVLTLEKVVQLMSSNVADIFGIAQGELELFKPANLCIYDLKTSYKLTKHNLASKSENTPFLGRYVSCKNLMTIVDGEIVYRENI